MTQSEYYQTNKDRNLDAVPDITELLSSIGQDVPLLGGLLKSFLSGLSRDNGPLSDRAMCGKSSVEIAKMAL